MEPLDAGQQRQPQFRPGLGRQGGHGLQGQGLARHGIEGQGKGPLQANQFRQGRALFRHQMAQDKSLEAGAEPTQAVMGRWAFTQIGRGQHIELLITQPVPHRGKVAAQGFLQAGAVGVVVNGQAGFDIQARPTDQAGAQGITGYGVFPE